MNPNVLLSFLDQSPTPFHAVEALKRSLYEHGFQQLREGEVWRVQAGGRYFVTRGETSMAAWIQGTDAVSEQGVRMIGAHTDSPNLRLKPQPNLSRHGYRQLGVEVYGGALLASWTDRDLSLAGRVFAEVHGHLEAFPLKVQRPLVRIPQLAIHLNREVNTQGLLLNRQKHLPPIFALKDRWEDEDALRAWLGETLHLPAESIRSWDLSLFDTQPSALWGTQSEFIAAPRLDNLFSCFCGMEALCQDARVQPWTQLLVCFDHEEIGSETTQGAESSFLEFVLRRLAEESGTAQAYERTVAQSLLLSADMAHAVHPNYAELHDGQHFPQMNAGPVIKVNAQGRYATSAKTEALFEQICSRHNIPVQKFVMRSDLACGSTIGPITAARLGIATVDVGAAMLAMHSIRETCGVEDLGHTIRAFSGFYRDELL